MKIVIVGGHGKIGLRLTRLLVARGHTVASIFRQSTQTPAVVAAGATPAVLSLEEDAPRRFSEEFAGADVVYFCAGAEGNGGPARYRAVDYAGALKVFDALEMLLEPRPRLIMLSALDVRDRARVPAHYTAQDRKHSEQFFSSIGPYLQAKYDADHDLSGRTAFARTMLRPGWLTNKPGTGRATIGKAPLGATVSRDDVALALATLAERPDAAGLGIDMNGGDEKIEDGLDRFIEAGESDFYP